MTENTEISVLVKLVRQLRDVLRTEGPFSPEFGRILENLNREYGRTLPGDTSTFPPPSQADGLGGDTSTFPPKPKPPKP